MLADALVGRSTASRELGRIAEAAGTSCRSALALAREVGYPGGEALALTELSQTAMHADDLGSAVRLGRQAGQITASIPGRIGRACTTGLAGAALIEAGDPAAAEGVCAAALASFRDAGHLENLTQLLGRMGEGGCADGPRRGRRAAHLRKRSRSRRGSAFGSSCSTTWSPADTCRAAAGRHAEAITVWAAYARTVAAPGDHRDARDGASRRQQRCARPGKRSVPTGRVSPRNAARP